MLLVTDLNEMGEEIKGRNGLKFNVETSGTQRLNEIACISTAKDEAGNMIMRLHGSAKSLLRDHRERV